ncbi:BnaA06g20410D [Brassica napus]|uniref:BnaA06g20410D protein n=1 Tax=Brassica napus TaxID=3708 RepID=A0A078H2A0_BRANA|nr:BnaA06g20410D [Brassica napus]
MTKSGKTSASTKEQVAAPPPPISLVDYCNDDEQTTPQGSLNSQDLMSEAGAVVSQECSVCRQSKTHLSDVSWDPCGCGGDDLPSSLESRSHSEGMRQERHEVVAIPSHHLWCSSEPTSIAKKAKEEAHIYDPRLGDEYLQNHEEEREGAEEAQRKPKKKGKAAPTSKTAFKSGPPPSVSRPKPSESSKRPSSSHMAYVSPHQSPRLEGKFQIIHLGMVAYPGESINVEEAKIALVKASISIRRIWVAMEALSNVVSQIAKMMNPKEGESEQDLQQSADERDDQREKMVFFLVVFGYVILFNFWTRMSCTIFLLMHALFRNYVLRHLCGCVSKFLKVLEKHPKLKRGRLKMQRSRGRYDTNASTTTNGSGSTTMSAYADKQDKVKTET